MHFSYNKIMDKPLSENRKAQFDYGILEAVEAGIELLGHEVKSVKSGRASLAGSRAVVRGGEIWAVNLIIPPYQPKNVPAAYDPARTRRLLLHKAEIARLTGLMKERGAVALPLKIYAKRGIIKILLGIGRSRTKQDKREILKKRAAARDAERDIRG